MAEGGLQVESFDFRSFGTEALRSSRRFGTAEFGGDSAFRYRSKFCQNIRPWQRNKTTLSVGALERVGRK